MSSSLLPGRPTTNTLATRILLLLCLVGAAVAAIVSIVVSVQSLVPEHPATNGWTITLTEPMAALAHNNSLAPPSFTQQTPNPVAAAAACVIAAALFAVVGILASRLLRRQLFTRPLAMLLIGAGCAVAAAAAVLALTGIDSATHSLAAAFIVAGLLLVVVGLVAERGISLQKDTEGLV